MAIKKGKTKIFSKDENAPKTDAPETNKNSDEGTMPPESTEKLDDANPETVDVVENEDPTPSASQDAPVQSSAKEAIVPKADSKPEATGPQVNDINVDMDKATINARVIVATNSVIGKKRYKLEKGKTYKISHNVYNVLKHAGKVL